MVVVGANCRLQASGKAYAVQHVYGQLPAGSPRRERGPIGKKWLLIVMTQSNHFTPCIWTSDGLTRRQGVFDHVCVDQSITET